MVKRQKEKQYQSAREYKDYSQLRSGTAGNAASGTVQRKLPFHCCALTLVPFTDPVCIVPSASSTNSNNNVVSVLFDNAALMEFLLKYKKNPLTGEVMTMNDIITLHMDQDDEGRWQCPILTKPFSDHTKIVAILCNNKSNKSKKKKKKEAYVYSYEAYKELNVKAKNYIDLTTGDKFSPKTDVLILNDPDQPQHDISQFWHIQNGRSIHNKNNDNNNKSNSNVQHSVTATRIMEQINKNKIKEEETNDKKKKRKEDDNDDDDSNSKKLKIYADDVTGVQYTSGKTAGSLTSTSMNISNEITTRLATQEEILISQFNVMKKSKEKGYVRLVTNLGDLLLELHCDIVPRTTTNFLGLCEQKKYNTTIFHRLIPKFMIQGGSSSKSKNEKEKEEKEQSLWGDPFKDEFDDRLKHIGPGIVSMANSGRNTNKQQFFITFNSCQHLDKKHTIFGKVIDGLDILKQMGNVPTDKKDRPIHQLQILDTDIISNPAKDAEEKEIQRIQEKQLYEEQQKQKQKQRGNNTHKNSSSNAASSGMTTKKAASSSTTTSTTTTKSSNMIGKYLPKTVLEQNNNDDDGDNDNADGGGGVGGSGGSTLMIPPSSKLSLPKATQNTKKSSKQPKKQTFGNFSGW